jgi:hypothetical protein
VLAHQALHHLPRDFGNRGGAGHVILRSLKHAAEVILFKNIGSFSASFPQGQQSLVFSGRNFPIFGHDLPLAILKLGKRPVGQDQ